MASARQSYKRGKLSRSAQKLGSKLASRSRMHGKASESCGRAQIAISNEKNLLYFLLPGWLPPAQLPLLSVNPENAGQNPSGRTRFGRAVAEFPFPSTPPWSVKRSGPKHGAPCRARPRLVSRDDCGCLHTVRRLRLRSKWCAGRPWGPRPTKSNFRHG